ncbi:MAG: methyltransferase domain-containing protein [Bacillota bacterium]|nr:methyltransferase domain-containing protein [Bacillota bacterium]
MILKEFFDYYFGVIEPEVLSLYQGLMPGTADLSSAYEEMFARNDEESIAFLLDFYRATAALRSEKPEQAILFNVHENVCFPFFVKYIWDVMQPNEKAKVKEQAGTDDIDAICKAFNDNRDLRNWFRGEIGSSLRQEDLFTMNEIIALQNFSSGGESSFLRFAYPYFRDMQGRVLDAGCGAGFATLVMSQYLDVYSVDACKARLERATALSHMMKQGEKKVFPGVIDLIQEELGGMAVECDFPSAEQLLSGDSSEVFFTEGSIDQLPYAEGYFDAINCLDVLEHTFSPRAIIKEFSRVAKKGGRVFVTAPTQYGEVEQRIHESIEGTMFPAMLHMHHFEPSSLTRLFNENGFKEVEVTPFDFMTWDDFTKIADKSPARSLAEELKAHPFEKVALQLFAVYERV